MKAHIVMRPTLLCWQLDALSQRAVEAAAAAGRYSLRVITPAEAGRTVGALAGAPGSSRTVHAVPATMTREPVLIFYQFTDAQLDGVLALLKSSKAPVELKAVVTPHNISWPFCQLTAELARERAALNSSANQG